MARDINELLATLDGAKRLMIVVHDNPDPDALAGASGLALLAKQRCGIHSRICCEGVIGRAENRVLVRELGIHLMDASRVRWDGWSHIALLDTQAGAGNNSLPKRRTPQIVIDHHPLHKGGRGKYIDVRPEYGSCTTIVHEYLTAAGVRPSDALAAAMCYAISTDTQDLAREGSLVDTQAYLALYPIADKRMLSRILHPRLKHAHYVTLARAALSAFTYGNIIGSHLGQIPNPDLVSLVADYLLQHERMGWSFVTGIWNGEMYLSLRATPGRHHAGNILRRLLLRRGHAGGHGAMAGGRIPVKDLTQAQIDELQKELALHLIHILKRRLDVDLKPLFPAEDVASVLP